MSDRAYQTPAFQHAVEYTVSLRLVIAGGKRRGTAERRGLRVAERLASYAARLADVVEVTGAAGVSHDGQVSFPRPIQFAAANTARSTRERPGTLSRYLDPERDRALRELAADNAAARARKDADRQRRSALGCRNTYQPTLDGERPCECVYCRPEDHLLAFRRLQRGEADSLRVATPRCLCGQPVAMTGQRCLRHRDPRLVVLDGDPPALQLLADHVPTS